MNNLQSVETSRATIRAPKGKKSLVHLEVLLDDGGIVGAYYQHNDGSYVKVPPLTQVKDVQQLKLLELIATTVEGLKLL